VTFALSQHPRETNGRFATKVGAAAEVALISVPVVEKSGLAHVGTLNAADKKSHSYEGQGLSVSQHPDAWQKIARLSGNVRKFSRLGRFLDFHELNDEQREDIATYALAQGWVERADVHYVSYHDDEWEQDMRLEFSDYDEALEEAEAIEAEVETVSGFKYLDLPDSTARPGETADFGIVTAAWVNEQRPDLDGVWWDDDLDESRLSAPRGVIVPSRIASWLA
jgi:hypothetical protein